VEIIHFLPDQLVIEKGYRPKGLYFIQTGRIKSTFYFMKEKLNLRIFGPGSFIGDEIFIQNQNAQFDYIVEDSNSIYTSCFFVGIKIMNGLRGKYQ